MEVSIVDPYGNCEPFVQAVRQAGLDYHVLEPGGNLPAMGSHRRPLRRGWRLLKSAPDIFRVRAKSRSVLGRLAPSVLCSNDFKSASLACTPHGMHVPRIVHLHGWYTPEMLSPSAKRFFRKKCAALLAVSYATKTAMICSGVDPQKIHVLHNPIDVEAMLRWANRPLEAPLPQAGRPVRILLPALVTKGKGQHTAIKALKLMLDAGHDAVLWLAGEAGPSEEYVNDVRDLARRLGVADRVEWLGLRRDVPQVMKAATVVILPSRSEGHPRVILEAMALAKPIVATPVGGITDMIFQNVTGWLHEVEDEEGLAECVSRIVRDPTGAEKVGKQAQEYCRLSFTPAQQVQRALEVFQMCASKAG